MELALKTKTITALEVACSRANPDQKIYVQDRLVLSGKTLFRIIKGTLGASEGMQRLAVQQGKHFLQIHLDDRRAGTSFPTR